MDPPNPIGSATLRAFCKYGVNFIGYLTNLGVLAAGWELFFYFALSQGAWLAWRICRPVASLSVRTRPFYISLLFRGGLGFRITGT